MSQFASNKVLRHGPEYIKTNVTIAHVCKAPAKADTLSEIQGKSFASVAFAGSDVSLGVSDDGLNVIMTTNAKSDLDPSDTATENENIAIVFCSESEVLACIDLTDRIITNETGDRIGFPAGEVEIKNWS
jgi:hypothetical protein